MILKSCAENESSNSLRESVLVSLL